MSEDYIYDYQGIKNNAKELGTILPENIVPKGVAILDFLEPIKQENSSINEKIHAMLLDRAIPETENFYQELTGDAHNNGDDL